MKKFLLVFTAILFLVSGKTAFANVVHQATGQTIIINGMVFTSQNPILNINDRLMVPFREFGERLGATVGWEASAQRITLTRSNLYSILYIGNSVVQHGEFVMMGNAFHPTSTNNSIMDSPALLVNGVTYIPLRAIAESMGATVDWDPINSIATIIAPYQGVAQQTPPLNNQQDNNQNQNQATLPDNYGDFSNTSHFQIISARQARARYEDSNNYPFIVVIYNSDEHDSRLIVPDLQDIAQDVGYRIFGVDRGVDNVNNLNSYNSWIWNFVRENTFQEPSMIMVHGRNNVEIMGRNQLANNPTTGRSVNVTNIEQAIRSFRTRTQTGIAPGDFRNTNWWQHRTSAQIRDMYQSGDELVVVLYDSSLTNAEFYVPFIIAAARDTEHLIYAVDIDNNPQYRNHLDFLPGINTNLANRMPMMFLVYNERNTNRTVEYNRPTSVDAAVSIIEEFLANSLFYTGGNRADFNNTDWWQNRTANQIRNMWNSNEEFIVVLYDSSLTGAATYVPVVMDAARQVDHRIYAVDIDANPNYRSQLDFLSGLTGNINNRLPITFLVYRSQNNNQNVSFDRSANLNTNVDRINQFLGNSIDHWRPNVGNNQGQGNINNQNQILANHTRFTNTTANDVLILSTGNHNFVVIVYDSRIASHLQILEEARYGAIAAHQDADGSVWVVNLATNPTTVQTAWLHRVVGSHSVSNPHIIHFRNNNIIDDMRITNNRNFVTEFINDAFR